MLNSTNTSAAKKYNLTLMQKEKETDDPLNNELSSKPRIL